jgi:putative ABC transport system permease protein
MQTLLHDLRYAVRQLRKTPGLTVLAVLSLTLGIGANTAIFTVIESVLLRPLPYVHADRLLFIGPAGDKPGFGSTSWLNYHDIAAQSKLLEYAAGYSEDVSVVEGKDGSQSVVAPRVTANLFSCLACIHCWVARSLRPRAEPVGRPLCCCRKAYGARPSAQIAAS